VDTPQRHDRPRPRTTAGRRSHANLASSRPPPNDATDLISPPTRRRPTSIDVEHT
jgi:hypothetical protein